jgi:ParB/RepB/Spo0J family partition protein
MAAGAPGEGASTTTPAFEAGRETTAARALFFPKKGPAQVPPEVCRPWEFADRPEGEFDHLDELVRSFRNEGQLQPAIVRPLEDPAHPHLRYEVIAGQARWRAAKQAGTLLDVVVRPMDDEAAFRTMVGENEFRRGLSDYAKARRLALALQRRLYPDKTSMAEAVGLSKAQLSYFLGFAELDPVVVAAIKRIETISARLGYGLNQAVQEGFLREVLRDPPRIEAGEIPRDAVPGVWRQGGKPKGGEFVAPVPRSRTPSRRFVNAEGKSLYRLRLSPSGASINVPAAVAAGLQDDFWDELAQLIQRRLPATDGEA